MLENIILTKRQQFHNKSQPVKELNSPGIEVFIPSKSKFV